MISKNLYPSNWDVRVHTSPVPQVQLQEQTRDLLAEIYTLLEDYAPSWYTQQLRKKIKSALELHQK